jgi:putative holliday junction resolvase
MRPNNVLALDIGTVRIGLARANTTIRLPELLATLKNDESFLDELKKIITEYDIDAMVVGLPRNMDGLETEQTQYVRNFCAEHLEVIGLPILWQDETLSSVAAQDILATKKGIHTKGDVDALAASIIVGDYLETL